MNLTPCKIRSCADWHANVSLKNKATLAGTIAIAVALACSPLCAQGIEEDIFADQHAALEALAAKCDLILRCKITDAVDPQKMYLQGPGLEATAPTEMYYKYSADTESPLKDAKGLWPDKVAATCPAGGVPVVIYTPARPRKAKDDPTPDAYYLPKLAKGKTHLLMLVKLPGTDKNVYYLPNNPQCVQSADEEHLAGMRKAMDQKNWPWSKAVNGLQMAMFASLEPLPQPKSTTAEAVKRPNLLLRVSLAVRNASDKPMAVNLNECDQCIAISALGPVGSIGVVHGLPEPRGTMPTSNPYPFRCIILSPGELAFITPFGEDAEFSVPLRLSPGKWTVTATYKSSREGKGSKMEGTAARGEPLWQGTVEASSALDTDNLGSVEAPP
jgi:hypothetical protein